MLDLTEPPVVSEARLSEIRAYVRDAKLPYSVRSYFTDLLAEIESLRSQKERLTGVVDHMCNEIAQIRESALALQREVHEMGDELMARFYHGENDLRSLSGNQE